MRKNSLYTCVSMSVQFAPEKCSLCFRSLMLLCMDLIGGRRIDIVTIGAALITVQCFPSSL